MKIFNKYFFASVCLTVGMVSCHDESPFSENDGEGLVRLSVTVNSKVTRAEDQTPAPEDALKESCRIYISNSKGVLHKWTGIDNMPPSVYLRYGSYLAEAMAGDSVSASFDKKYFKGSQQFEVSAANASTQVTVACKIANVVASVDEGTIKSEYVRDLVLTVSNERGELVFNSDHYMDKGYFMMPKGNTSLHYTVTGKDLTGKEFSRDGVVEDVKGAHDYRFSFKFDPSQTPNNGGTFITIQVEEIPLIEEEYVIQAKPTFVWSGSDLAIDDQIQGTKGNFQKMTLLVGAFGELKALSISSENAGIDDTNLISTPDALKEKGIVVTDLGSKTTDGVTIQRCSIEFLAEWFNNLAESNTEYVVKVSAVDANNKSSSVDVRVGNTTAAYTYKDPVVIDVDLLNNDFTAVGATSVTVPVNIALESATDMFVEYCKDGEAEWQSVPVNATRAVATTVRLNGLTPATKYKLRTSGIVNGKKTISSETEVTTESIFTIPNASMEEWSNYSENSKVLLPAAGGVRSFWDSGNHGSSTMNKTITNKSTDFYHTGSASAELKSQFVGLGLIGKFAAGNLFVGEYQKTDGTNGILSFGREYNGSHPSALSLWVNYRPGIVKTDGTNSDYNHLAVGDTDFAQIYVALTTDPVEIRTNPKSLKLFEPDGDYIVAYGQVTLDKAFGGDNQLENLVIELQYKDRAKNTRPKYLVIVCSASKYGDYFEGGEGSLLYVDDFELVYE